jgi:hypothetical protein
MIQFQQLLPLRNLKKEAEISPEFRGISSSDWLKKSSYLRGCIVGTSTAVLEEVAIIMHNIAQLKVIIETAILFQIIYIIHLFGFCAQVMVLL